MAKTMTMRRISVLLVAVVMLLTMVASTALASHEGNRKSVCFKGNTITFKTERKQDRFLRNHPRATAGKCHKGKNIGQLIANKTVKPFR